MLREYHNLMFLIAAGGALWFAHRVGYRAGWSRGYFLGRMAKKDDPWPVEPPEL